MILQKDLTLYRLDNRMPNEHAPEAYEYQLFKDGQFVLSKFTNDEYPCAKVIIGEGLITGMYLTYPADIDSREMEDQNIYLVDVKVIEKVKI